MLLAQAEASATGNSGNSPPPFLHVHAAYRMGHAHFAPVGRALSSVLPFADRVKANLPIFFVKAGRWFLLFCFYVQEAFEVGPFSIAGFAKENEHRVIRHRRRPPLIAIYRTGQADTKPMLSVLLLYV